MKFSDMINELESNLKDVLGWHKSQVQCLVQIVVGLIAIRSVNLKGLAYSFMGDTELNSHYRRLQRCFCSSTLSTPRSDPAIAWFILFSE